MADVQLTQVLRRAEEVRTPGPRLEQVRRIVVARNDRLGDLLLTLPTVDALRRAYPQARLALSIRESLLPLGRMVEGVDRLLPASSNPLRASRALRAYGTDLLVCVSRGPGLALAGLLARVRHRVGTGYRLHSPLFTRRVAERRRAGGRHELEYALSFAHRAGAAPGPERFGLRLPEAAIEEADRWLRRHQVAQSFLLFHPGSGGSCPAWPFERFAQLASLLRAAGRGVVFSVGPADERIARALQAAPREVRELPRCGGGIPLLAALSRRATAVVSNSTGPLHLAAALDVPTLGFYAPWATCGAARWGPYASNGYALVVESEEAKRWPRARRRRDGSALLAAISAERACETLLCELLALPGGEEPVRNVQHGEDTSHDEVG
jgi:heptosyltransferase-2